jgi:spore germination protein GerM
MSQYDFKLPSSRVRELIIGILPNETNSAVNIFPKGIDTDDLLGVSVSGDIAYVDFSLYLKRACNYDAAKESIFIYSIVNTLTELKSIKKVQILIDGEIQDSLCGNLSIEKPLMPNPGIIQR